MKIYASKPVSEHKRCTWKLLRNLAALIVLVAPTAVSSAFALDDGAIRSVKIKPLRGLSGAAANIGSGDLEIKQRPIQKTNGKTIGQLLLDSKIQPDNDSLTLIYKLNPEIPNIQLVKDGTTLNIPYVQSKKSNQTSPVCKLTVDETKKKKLNQSITKFEQIANKLSNNSSLMQKPAGISIKKAAESYKLFSQDPNIALSDDVLEQMTQELKVAEQIGTKLVNIGTIDEKDLKRIQAVSADIDVRRSWLSTTTMGGSGLRRWQDAEVTVTLNGKPSDNGQVCRDRVYYCPVALHGIVEAKHPFTNLGSPVKQHIPEATYFFWCERDNRVNSDLVECVVRAQQTNSIALLLNGEL